MQDKLILEACVETLVVVGLAQQKGPDRIELCADLSQEGLTSSHENCKQMAVFTGVRELHGRHIA